ncbi:hypothetical protein [Paenibacillus lemnae]|uniref:Uncharacterized protein n=1 Tax=Paenibacillus lemnae TaxID=1330551 RepID=A0A848M7D8_PAELE|nr:hypothetical protein [Paenibacillus lemnae]NMO96595.1 hypothetical protein [Paenibacillus lemnae]
MSELVSYELDQIEPKHEERIRDWLNDVQQNGGEKEYFIHSFDNETADNMYAYVYGKGFTDYEVSFIYNTSNNRAEVHVAGIEGQSETDHFVKVKMINDQSITIVFER